MKHDISSPIQFIKGVGPHRASLLERLGIRTLKDALYFLPSRYEDRTSTQKINILSPEQSTTITGKILKTELITKNRGFKIFELVITDGHALMRMKWFNQPYMKKIFKPGQTAVFYGLVKSGFRGIGFEMHNPEYELISEEDDETDTIHTGRIVPVYRCTEGLSQRQMRSIMHTAAAASASLIDPLPSELITKYRLPSLSECLQNVHFPQNGQDIDKLNNGTTIFHKRLSFDELFQFQLGLALKKSRQQKESGIRFRPGMKLINRLISSLPFQLTSAQHRVVREILDDMSSDAPMNRLLQGDVGSGKTIVALISMLAAVECGYQAALMAPTEILAEQHYLNFKKYMELLNIKIELVTSATKNKTCSSVKEDADILIGTHALIQKDIKFKKLGLIIIDEQHRFGVMQRAALRQKGINPDTLVMTATPIPRTLSLTLYGELDCSVINELPPRRTPVVTKIFDEKYIDSVYKLIDEETKKGRQVYIVYPLIEESEKLNLKNAVKGMELFTSRFPDLKISMLHGRIPATQREDIMKNFKSGYINILVSTTVIEVGIDVPNATLMVIIHAERFGLSQLHQLRGRVGRGAEISYCALVAHKTSEDSKKRLEAMQSTTDGFKLSEVDLEIRGPGEFFGTRQSGMPDLKAANLLRDTRILEAARKEALSIVEYDPMLSKYPQLREAVELLWGKKLEILSTA
ncbi:MAG: ATP-dependent DNA helicase RecG [Dissulfurispiraceae bacterium]|jgi:ATP-dependent DNA helicase RecG|nr:ATP-dependent DNA helicase RecG [Dissulfurispiraceae bacterium]